MKNTEIERNGKLDFYSLIKNINIVGFGNEDDIISTEKYSKTIFDKIKIKAKLVLDGFLSEDYSELAYTMLFGDKANLNEDIYDVYSASGISHLLAVSGLHVGFVVTLLGLFLSLFKLKDKSRFIIISVFVFLYAFMCEWTTSVTRAFIMTVILLFSKLRKTKYDSLSSLAFAGLIILFINPISIFDVGFMLSFSAVASIIIFSRTFTNFFSKFLHIKLASAISVSLAASIGTNLVIMLSFDKLSLFSIVTNCIVIPIASVAFMLMFTFVLLGMVIYPLGIGSFLFEPLMKVVTGVGTIAGVVSLAGLNNWLVLGFGAFLITGAVFVSDYSLIQKKNRIILGSISLLFSSVCFILMFIC